MKYIDDCFRDANALTEVRAKVLPCLFTTSSGVCVCVCVCLQHSHEGIRKAAIYAVGQFCRLWYKWLREAGSTDLGIPHTSSCVQCMKLLLHTGELEYLVNGTVLSLSATARTDSDRNVVGITLETLETLLKSLKVLLFRTHSRERPLALPIHSLTR